MPIRMDTWHCLELPIMRSRNGTDMVSAQLYTTLKNQIYQHANMYSISKYVYIVTILVTIDGVWIGNGIY
jgi:hypothetical protein